MIFFIFLIGSCFAVEIKGPRPDPTIEIVTESSEYDYDLEIPTNIFKNIISTLEKNEKSNRIIYIDNNDHLDSSFLGEIQSSNSHCPVQHIYIVISLLSAILLLNLLITFFEFITMKQNSKKYYEKGERMIVNEI